MTKNDVGGAPGAVLGGRYRLGALIGRGGMSSVYEARDQALERTVAVKLFRADISDPDELNRQEVEAKLLARLNHPNLVTVFDAGTDAVLHESQTYLVMELVRGTDLRRTLQQAPLPSEEVARVGAGMADALEYIHRSGVIHRDVKPANILMNNEDAGGYTRPYANPKLADFGIARLVDGARLTATGESLGTAMYFSPEQAAGEAISPASDIYSLGLVLLECLTGTTAFPGPAIASAAARLQRDPDIPNFLSAGWKQLLTSMTARDPEARPMAPQAADALRALRTSNAARPAQRAADTPTEANRTASVQNTARAHLDSADALPLTLPGHAVPAQPTARPVLEVPDDTGRRPALPWKRGAAQAGTARQNDDQGEENRRNDGGAAEPSGDQSTAAVRGTASDAPAGPQMGTGSQSDVDTPRMPPRRRKVLLSAFSALAAGVTAVLLVMGSLGSSADPEPVPYPSVPGELGEHLEQLQESAELQ